MKIRGKLKWQAFKSFTEIHNKKKVTISSDEIK